MKSESLRHQPPNNDEECFAYEVVTDLDPTGVFARYGFKIGDLVLYDQEPYLVTQLECVNDTGEDASFVMRIEKKGERFSYYYLNLGDIKKGLVKKS